MNADPSSRPIPAEPLGGDAGPEWRLPAGHLRKIATRISHLSEWDNVTVENRGQGYMFVEYENADGVLIRESLMPGDDAPPAG
jgi:hypothetical protein